MGEIGEQLGKYVTRFGSMLLGNWLASHPGVQAYFWPATTIVIVGGVFIAFVREHADLNTDSAEPSRTPIPAQTPSIRAARSIRVQHLREKYGIVAPKRLMIPLVTSSAFLVLAIFATLPYDFFVLLRVVLFTTCASAVIVTWKSGFVTNWQIIFFTLGILYNPLLPMHLHRETWGILNALTLVILAGCCLTFVPHRSLERASDEALGPPK